MFYTLGYLTRPVVRYTFLLYFNMWSYKIETFPGIGPDAFSRRSGA